MTASPWPALYFKSRGVAVSDFTTLISKAVAGADDPEQTRARQILDAYPELEEGDLRQAMEYAAWLAGGYRRPFGCVLPP